MPSVDDCTSGKDSLPADFGLDAEEWMGQETQSRRAATVNPHELVY